MAISAQDKIMHVANKLGLSSLKYMQASTGAIYDGDFNAGSTFNFFTNSVQKNNPELTNISDNRFEVNEALLVETIGFYGFPNPGSAMCNLSDSNWGENDYVIVFDMTIGNKKVMKETPVFVSGSPACFASSALTSQSAGPDTFLYQNARHQVYMEGAGILIPPQVDFSVNAKIYDVITGELVSDSLGCYLHGTRVLLNFNTTI